MTLHSPGTGASAGLERAASATFEPKVVAFVCNWCAYAGADQAGLARSSYPPNVHLVRLMCSGRWDPQFAFKAFDAGADGILILGCHPGDCHYQDQNLRTLQRHRLLLRLLRPLGIGEERCRLDFVSAVEGDKFVRVVTEMVAELRRLGPLGITDDTGEPPVKQG